MIAMTSRAGAPQPDIHCVHSPHSCVPRLPVFLTNFLWHHFSTSVLCKRIQNFKYLTRDMRKHLNLSYKLYNWIYLVSLQWIGSISHREPYCKSNRRTKIQRFRFVKLRGFETTTKIENSFLRTQMEHDIRHVFECMHACSIMINTNSTILYLFT